MNSKLTFSLICMLVFNQVAFARKISVFLKTQKQLERNALEDYQPQDSLADQLSTLEDSVPSKNSQSIYTTARPDLRLSKNSKNKILYNNQKNAYKKTALYAFYQFVYYIIDQLNIFLVSKQKKLMLQHKKIAMKNYQNAQEDAVLKSQRIAFEQDLDKVNRLNQVMHNPLRVPVKESIEQFKLSKNLKNNMISNTLAQVANNPDLLKPTNILNNIKNYTLSEDSGSSPSSTALDLVDLHRLQSGQQTSDCQAKKPYCESLDYDMCNNVRVFIEHCPNKCLSQCVDSTVTYKFKSGGNRLR